MAKRTYTYHTDLEKTRIGTDTRYKLVCIGCKVSFWGWKPNGKFCSRRCRSKQPRRAQAISLEILSEANLQPTHQEQLLFAAKKAKVHPNTVARAAASLGYAWTRPVPSKVGGEGTLRSKIKTSSCAICPESRATEAAHVIPQHEGGSGIESNIVPLCPTHHRLWDMGLLCQQESEDLEYIFSKKIGHMGAFA